MGDTIEIEPKTSGPINAILFDRAHGTMRGGSSDSGDDYGIAWSGSRQYEVRCGKAPHRPLPPAGEGVGIPAIRDSGRWYDRGMKSKTSVTLSEELLAAIDSAAGRGVNRSEFLERAGWDRVLLLRRQRRDALDRKRLEAHASTLNAEALDVLEYQIEP